jgi:hypothetical protein
MYSYVKKKLNLTHVLFFYVCVCVCIFFSWGSHRSVAISISLWKPTTWSQQQQPILDGAFFFVVVSRLSLIHEEEKKQGFFSLLFCCCSKLSLGANPNDDWNFVWGFVVMILHLCVYCITIHIKLFLHNL